METIETISQVAANGIDSIISHFIDYQSVISAIIASIIVIIIWIISWRNKRKSDLLKYEFITTVSHKFRTPLTGIKWATENLNGMKLPPEAIEQIDYIKNSNEKLVELTDLLMNTSRSMNDSYKYNYVDKNISDEIEKVLTSLTNQLQTKKTNIFKDIQPNVFAKIDAARVKFVIQSFIENSIHYTKEEGTILIKLKKTKNEVIFSVHDTGMGIDKKELPLIFEKFYRTTEARTTDTEGMGIGLFVSKEIIKHHKGKVWVESDGIDKGSTFYFSLPITEKIETEEVVKNK